MARDLAFKSWSQTRLNDYDQCPFMAKHKHLLKTCPLCFKGEIKGGYDSPAVCTHCRKEIVKGAALVKGSAIGKTLENYVKGESLSVSTEWTEADGTKKSHKLTHPKVIKLMKSFRAAFKKGKVEVERLWNFDRNFRPLKPGWSPDVWLIVKTDVYSTLPQKVGRVDDWKSGGCDRDGKPREDPKYDEQLRIYSVAALSRDPSLARTASGLVFVEADKKHDPVVERPAGYIERKDLEKHQKDLTRRVLPLLNDRTFAPKANDKCKWCDFSKTKGGPCRY